MDNDEEKGGDNMVLEGTSQAEGNPRNEEFNARKGEDMYGFLFANEKLILDNAMVASQVNNQTAAISLQQAVSFQQKANDLYLGQMDSREKEHSAHMDAHEKAQNTMNAQRLAQSESEMNQRLEHENEIETTRQENQRYTLNYLYSVEGAEAMGTMALAQSIVEMMKAQGMVIKKE